MGVSPNPTGTGCNKGVRVTSAASAMRFVKNLIKQKFQGTPDLVGHLLGPQI